MLTQGKNTAEFLLSEGNGFISREQIVVSSAAGALVPGTILSAVRDLGEAEVTAAAGNTGDAAVPVVTVADTAKPGRYTLTVITEAANAGTFRVEGPDGSLVGTGTVAVAFNEGGLSFTLADGTNDWDINDRLFIDVSFEAVEYVAYTAGGDVAGILYAAAHDMAVDQKAVMICRHAEVQAAELTGLDAKARADLLALGIVCR